MSRPQLLRPGILHEFLSFAGGEDFHHLPVLGHGPAGYGNGMSLLKQLAYHLIAQGPAGILFSDELPDQILYPFDRHFLAISPHLAAEEEFQLVDPLRCMHIFVRRHPAYRRLVHLDIVGYFSQDKGLKGIDSLFKKISLKCNNAFGNLVQGHLSLLDTPDQPEG